MTDLINPNPLEPQPLISEPIIPQQPIIEPVLPLIQPSPTNQYTPTSNNESKKSPLIFIIILIILFALCIGAYFFLKKPTKTVNTNTPTTPTSTKTEPLATANKSKSPFKKPETYNSAWFSFAVDFPTEQNYQEFTGRIVIYRDDCYLAIDQFAESDAKTNKIDISTITKPDQILNGLGKQIDNITYSMHGAPPTFNLEIDKAENMTINGFEMVKQTGSIYRANVADAIGKYGFMSYATFVSGKPVYVMIVDSSKDQRYFKGIDKAYTLTQDLTMEEIIDGVAQTIRLGVPLEKYSL